MRAGLGIRSLERFSPAAPSSPPLLQVTWPKGPLACMHSGTKPPDPMATKLCQVFGFCLPKKPSPTPFWL